MNKEKPSKDLKSWQENLIGFFAFSGILLFLCFFYDSIVNEVSESSTKVKFFRSLLKYLDTKFGKEYVFGFVIIIMIIAGTAALRGFLNNRKKER
ncbi:hypothetical protein [Tenuifilum osseticum]|uniref:hypothetical protein n=1 Tax=Tenuifilum osseticum TaxID=3374723 RepID=UPI0034E4CBC5